MADTESRTVGKSEASPPPVLVQVVPGQTPQDGTDNPTTRQSDNEPEKKEKAKPRASLAAPLILLVVVVLAAGGVLAVRQWGWWGLAAAAAGLIVVMVAAVWWWRHPARRSRSRSTRRSTSRTGGGIPGLGKTRSGGGSGGGRKGLLGRLGSRSGGAGKGRGGLLSRLAGRSGGGTSGRSRTGTSGRGGTRAGGRSGRGTSGRGSVLGRGRGPRMGRGGALLSTGSGSSLGGRSGRSRRGGKFFGGRRGRARSTPGIGAGWRRGGGHMLAAPALPSLDATKNALRKTDKAIGKAAGRGWFATADAVTGAVGTIKPDRITQHNGDTDVKSEFEKIAETIPGSADRDPVTQHDIGIIAVISGMKQSYEYIAQYVDKYKDRIETENYAGTEPLTIETLDAVARATRACAPVIEEAMKVLKLSPSWQDLENRMDNPKAVRSDVGLAQRMGLL